MFVAHAIAWARGLILLRCRWCLPPAALDGDALAGAACTAHRKAHRKARVVQQAARHRRLTAAEWSDVHMAD